MIWLLKKIKKAAKRRGDHLFANAVSSVGLPLSNARLCVSNERNHLVANEAKAGGERSEEWDFNCKAIECRTSVSRETHSVSGMPEIQRISEHQRTKPLSVTIWLLAKQVGGIFLGDSGRRLGISCVFTRFFLKICARQPSVTGWEV